MSDKFMDTARAVAKGAVKHAGIVLAVFAAFALGLCLASGGSSTGGQGGRQGAGPAEIAPAEVWTCPMHPQIRKPGPGACPICGMDLVQVEDTTDGGEPDSDGGDNRGRITLSERARTLAGIRTAEVRPMTTATRELRLLGRIDYDESRLKTVTAWTGGRIDRLRVATTGRTVKAQQTIARLYSPELYAAQSDLIQARRQVERLAGASESARRAAEIASAAAEQRLRLLGVPNAEIAAMRAADAPRKHVWIRTPFAGTVTERLVDEGNYVQPGTPLYRLADLSRVWVQLDAYETDLPHLALGDQVSLGVIGLPERSFEGAVSFIDPVVDPGTRIVKLRVEVDNADGALRPGMFAEAVLHSDRVGAATLTIPRTAPLFTGTRSLVYVEVDSDDRPTYEAREVTLGPRVGEFYPVLAGLEIGEQVVVRGAFVIDADLQIRGGASMMTRDDDIARALRRPVSELPDSARARLAAVLTRYLAVRAALAEDDLASARTLAVQLADEVPPVAAAMPESVLPRWQPLGADIADLARWLHGRNDIVAARLAFRRLGERAMQVLQVFGNPLAEELRVMYCPDDFDDGEQHGGYGQWLQGPGALGNPFGRAKPDMCSRIRTSLLPREHLPPDEPTPAGSHSDAGHQH